jgi:hypothetical protein
VLERLITFFSSLFALRFRDGNVALIKKESFCFSLRLVLNGFSHFLKIFREKKKKKTERKTSSLTKPKETETKFYSVAISLSFHLLIFFFLF